MSTNAFNPTGNTVTFLAAVTAPTPVQAPSNGIGCTAVRIINSGANVVFMGVGPDANTATASAVNVTSSQPAIPLLPGTDEILIFPPGSYFTGITLANTCQVYLTPGEGL